MALLGAGLAATSVLLTVLTASALSSGAEVWPSPDNLSGSPGRSHQAWTTVDTWTGDIWIVWSDEAAAEREEILGRRWRHRDGSWEPSLALPAQNLSLSEWQDSGPALAFDSQGRGLLLWTRRYAMFQGAPVDGTDVLWRFWDGEQWSEERVLYHTDLYLPSSYGYSLIPVERPTSVLLFLTWDTGYQTAEFVGGSWSELSGWAYLDVRLAQVIEDPGGTLHAAAYGDNSADWGFNDLFYDAYYLTHSGASWTEPQNLSYTDGVANNVGLAFDARGRLHFLWSDPDSPYSQESVKSAIWERILDGGAWSPNADITDGNPEQAINGFSLTPDVGDNLHLAWSEGVFSGTIHTDLGIHYRVNLGTGWGFGERVHTSPLDSRYPSLSVGHGTPFLTWQEGPVYDQDVLVARLTGPLSGPCLELSGLAVDGPAGGAVGVEQRFTVSAGPLTATLPISYTWQVPEHSPLSHLGGYGDVGRFTWSEVGAKRLAVTAETCGAHITASFTHTVEALQLVWWYLPLASRGSTR